MTPIADMVDQMLAAGVAREVIVLAVRTAEQSMSTSSRVESRVDKAIENRREWDRNYRRRKRDTQVDSTRHPPDIHPTQETPLILKEVVERESVSKKVRGGRKQKADIPLGWKPPQRALDLALEFGVRVEDVEPRFRDWLASSGHQYADYDAGFCNFIRNTPKFNGGQNGHGHRNNRANPAAGPAASGADAILAGMGRLAARVRRQDDPAKSGDGEASRGLDIAGEPLAERNATDPDTSARRSAELDLLEDARSGRWG